MGWSQERGRKYSVQTRFWSMGQLVLCMHFRTCRAVVNLQVSPSVAVVSFVGVPIFCISFPNSLSLALSSKRLNMYSKLGK